MIAVNQKSFEDEVDVLLSRVGPAQASNAKRRDVAHFIRDLLTRYYEDAFVIECGSSCLKSYLPESDLDLILFVSVPSDRREQILHQRGVFNALCEEIALKDEGLSKYYDMTIRNVELVNARTKVTHCVVNNITVDITVNQIGALNTLMFLEEVDRMIGYDHLFKRSLILIKDWCAYETTKHCGASILGAKVSMFSSYALTVLVLHLFNRFTLNLTHPFSVLRTFLFTYMTFPWDTHALSVEGPISVTDLNKPYLHSKGRNNKLPLYPNRFKKVAEKYSIKNNSNIGKTGEGVNANFEGFRIKFCNIIDPLDSSNNLGISVSKLSLTQIILACQRGYHQLENILRAYHFKTHPNLVNPNLHIRPNPNINPTFDNRKPKQNPLPPGLPLDPALIGKKNVPVGMIQTMPFPPGRVPTGGVPDLGVMPSPDNKFGTPETKEIAPLLNVLVDENMENRRIQGPLVAVNGSVGPDMRRLIPFQNDINDMEFPFLSQFFSVSRAMFLSSDSNSWNNEPMIRNDLMDHPLQAQAVKQNLQIQNSITNYIFRKPDYGPPIPHPINTTKINENRNNMGNNMNNTNGVTISHMNNHNAMMIGGRIGNESPSNSSISSSNTASSYMSSERGEVSTQTQFSGHHQQVQSQGFIQRYQLPPPATTIAVYPEDEYSLLATPGPGDGVRKEGDPLLGNLVSMQKIVRVLTERWEKSEVVGVAGSSSSSVRSDLGKREEGTEEKARALPMRVEDVMPGFESRIQLELANSMMQYLNGTSSLQGAQEEIEDNRDQDIIRKGENNETMIVDKKEMNEKCRIMDLIQNSPELSGLIHQKITEQLSVLIEETKKNMVDLDNNVGNKKENDYFEFVEDQSKKKEIVKNETIINEENSDFSKIDVEKNVEESLTVIDKIER